MAQRISGCNPQQTHLEKDCPTRRRNPRGRQVKNKGFLCIHYSGKKPIPLNV
jgi:hypothetical protein